MSQNKEQKIPEKSHLGALSTKLQKAIVLTLDLNNSEQVFIGNEEIMFLNILLKRLPDSTSGAPTASYKLENTKDKTFYRFYDIWKDEEDYRKASNRRRSLRVKIKDLIIYLINIIQFLINKQFIHQKLKKKRTIIHSHAHLRRARFKTSELTPLFFKPSEKNLKLRDEFRKNLLNQDLEHDFVSYLVDLFPTSHLELYEKLSEHKVANIRIDTVVTSIFGIMADPLLSFIVRNNNAKLVYVQHGGGYGLNKDRLDYVIEHEGADTMYYWGTGDHNVFPTRYRTKNFGKINSKIFFVLSERKNTDPDSVNFYLHCTDIVNEKCPVDCKVIAYPNAKFDDIKNTNLRYGLRYRDHEKSRLVVYDSIRQSFIYARIMTRRPFLIVDEMGIYPGSENAIKFLNFLKESEILISRNQLQKKVLKWSKIPLEKVQEEFDKVAFQVFDHVLKQPRIEDLFR